MKTSMKTNTKTKRKLSKLSNLVEEKIDLYTLMIKSIWKSAMDLPCDRGKMKKKEAVATACSLARVVAESQVDEGESLSECIRRAAMELLQKAEEMERCD